jgi:hypothetical protein
MCILRSKNKVALLVIKACYTNLCNYEITSEKVLCLRNPLDKSGTENCAFWTNVKRVVIISYRPFWETLTVPSANVYHYSLRNDPEDRSHNYFAEEARNLKKLGLFTRYVTCN